MRLLVVSIALLAIVLPVCAQMAEPGTICPIRIYLDADCTGTAASSISIEQGIRTALDEVGGKLAGRPVALVVRDHRGNTRRSKKHLEEYLADEQALVLFSGLHSPPLLAHRDFINENGILVLDPWAAAASITRYPSPTNSIFRLSVDDAKAGGFLIDHVVKQRGCKRPALLLEETGWGTSNEKNMLVALRKNGLRPACVKWFNWNLKENGARILLRSIADSQADMIMLVANAPEGKTFARAMASFPPGKRLPICSHWGITGGDFPQVIGPELRQQLDLNFIQTRFSFVCHRDDTFGTAVFERAAKLFPEAIETREDIEAPTGFVHAYDLTRILIAAVEQAELGEDIGRNREAVRAALENLETPVRGLIKTYERPFGPFSEATPDAHEALSAEDYVMARYGSNNEVLIEADAQ